MTANLYLIISNIALISAIIVIVVGIVAWRRLRQDDLLKYEFITIIIHKFRTPLTQIKWSMEELRAGEVNQDKLESLKNMESSNKKLVDLTSALIKLSNPKSSSSSLWHFEKLSLSDLLKSVSDSFKNNFSKKQITFDLNCPPEDVLVSADKEGVKFIIQTLLENALAYTPNNGTISLSLETVSNKAAISVTDSGIGIKKNDIDFIFTRFFRTENAKKTDTEGFGIGLSLAHSVAIRHGGDIKVYSEGEGKGSTFKLILPKIR